MTLIGLPTILITIISLILAEASKSGEIEERLRSKGITIKAQQGGCEIAQDKPLEAMSFFVRFTKAGRVYHTRLYDTDHKGIYEFWTTPHRPEFHAHIRSRPDSEDLICETTNNHDYDEMNEDGLLPLSHISQGTKEVLQTYSRGLTKMDLEGCLYVVDAILNDPPALYEDYKGSSEWILKFHRGARTWMEDKVKDILKRKTSKLIPEAAGVCVGAVYCLALSLFLPFHMMCSPQGVPVDEAELMSQRKASLFMGSLLSINAMCFLGFADNVLDLPWRIKLIIPTVATLPLLLVYYSSIGNTWVLLPDIIRPYIPGGHGAIDIGVLYYIFLSLLSVFCTNAINILAGINGLEIGQSMILAISLILNDLLQLYRHADQASTWPPYESHLMSLYLLLPFVGASLPLMVANMYPATAFVGDTYCYLAGMTLAASGILGQCSKTTLLFFGPQIFNFLYSVPQLFKLIPCPRHRLPHYTPKTDLLSVSYTPWFNPSKDLNFLGRLCLSVIQWLHLAKVETNSDNNEVRVQNLTLINLVLWLKGDTHEDTLNKILLLIQCMWSLCAFYIRYGLAGFVYNVVD
ncbi:UDP-N-acetylglucosamine--dolichyl-phosphate N-acetylglucosaminephosphotransferase [Perkinsus chesapeaki]|uniref:UDP-N-acetylglucosamine--dolichyl-phosphate N-acetylglucosaminephosphotransferase n=1 Tax=Perkinsus chesapeaki TaxID=330153 RepID=A0A7J6MLB1_PERCH|nr:UDP-N-acetylglucosamine--dolichyl-phosphate N-acetylglucosaminephosphotransferase [Perkinsus chesapeaki]